MQSPIRREVARMAEQEALVSEGATPIPLPRLQEILSSILSRQATTNDALQSLGYPPEILARLHSVMEHFDALNFWMWLEVRGQVLLSLAAYLEQVNGFVETVNLYTNHFPQLTPLCLKVMAECDALSATVLKNFYPIPEMHILSSQSDRVRQVMETLGG